MWAEVDFWTHATRELSGCVCVIYNNINNNNNNDNNNGRHHHLYSALNFKDATIITLIVCLCLDFAYHGIDRVGHPWIYHQQIPPCPSVGDRSSPANLQMATNVLVVFAVKSFIINRLIWF